MAARVIFCEGEKDCDRLWSLEIPATTTMGGAGAFTPYAESYITQLLWAGVREVVVLPDYDAAGWGYMTDVLTACVEWGIQVRWCLLPGIDALGIKGADVSNWLDAGHTTAELVAAIAAAPVVTAPPAMPDWPDRERSAEAAPATSAPASAATTPPRAELVVNEGRICRIRHIRGGHVLEPLANFTAEITNQQFLDDGGLEPRCLLTILGRLASGEPLPAVRVPAAKYAALTWIVEGWGARPTVAAGPGARDQLRKAIQDLSPNLRSQHVYTHTGWRHLPTGWGYLTAAGAVAGPDSVAVELEGRLAHYRIPREPTDPAAALRASLALWDLGPLEVTVPLWGSMYAAPFAEWLPVDYSLWIEGHSQTYKTSVALLFLAHFGAFPGTKTLPAAWLDTDASLERKLYLIKDAPLLIDDFVAEADGAHLKAVRVLREQGNKVGRGRRAADLSARPDFPPRGLMMATAEHRPRGLSLASRCLVLSFRPGLIDVAALSRSQRDAGRLPHAMSGFLSWLAPQIAPGWAAALRESFEQAREAARESGAMARVPEVVAHVWIGISEALRYAQAIGVLAPGPEADRRLDEAWTALLGAKAAQESEIEGQRETRVFLATLWGLLQAGRAALLDRDQRADGRGRQDLVGWEDREAVYLSPSVAVQAVNRALRDSGGPVPALEEDRLGRYLRDDGVLILGEGARPRRQVRLGGVPMRVWMCRRTRLAEFTGESGWSSEPVETPTEGRRLW